MYILDSKFTVLSVYECKIKHLLQAYLNKDFIFVKICMFEFNIEGIGILFLLYTPPPNQKENVKITPDSNFDAEAFGDIFSTLYNRI